MRKTSPSETHEGPVVADAITRGGEDVVGFQGEPDSGNCISDMAFELQMSSAYCGSCRPTRPNDQREKGDSGETKDTMDRSRGVCVLPLIDARRQPKY
ncbi:hypothetical protein EV1_029414 [Malus domestica]